MTFESAETSVESGRPLRLYEFRRGVIRWRYTDADQAVQFGFDIYEPIAISDDGIRETGETSADLVKVTVPWNTPVARLYRGVPPAGEIELVIRDMHHGESEAPIVWIGPIQTVQFPSPDRAVIVCESLTASLDRPGVRLGYERGCPYSLYDHNCGVDPDAHVVTVTIESFDGVSVSASELENYEDGWFAAGYVEWDLTLGEVDQRPIETHTGPTIVLMGGTQGLSAGQALRVYPGCARTAMVCLNKFHNLRGESGNLGYGGFPHLPGKSPFDGNPLF